ncbi:MAG: 50S ribosomal protein L7ae [Clostridiaceae bacterium]|nr:50S ribosomal protein L7ae [Clostridiaceae bacterium]
MMHDRVYSFIGLAVKAGKLLSGDETCERALKAGMVRLVIVSEDASGNTRKKFMDMCNYRNVAIRCFGKKEKLGGYTGRGMRSVVAVIDRNFAERLLEIIDDHGKEHGGV